jgi:hypothetical protein
MKKLIIILLVLIVIIAGLSLGKDMIAKTAVERGAQMVTGLQLRMAKINIGIFNTLVNIDNLVLYNPRDFKDRIMIDMPNIYVDYNLGAIIKGKVHLYDMRIDLKEFVVVKNKDGKLNLDSLKVVQAQKEGKKPQDKDKAKAPEMQIDSLQLKIGKVIYKDYSTGSASPVVREFNVNINEKFTNINDPYTLVSIIVVKALTNTAIASLTNFDLGGLSHTVKGTLSKATKLATDTAGKATKIIGDTGKAVTDTAGKITEKLTFPFGGRQE